MKARDKASGAVEAARPYVERIATDDQLHDHVKNAYQSARRVYDELILGRGATGTAIRVAQDKELQDELRRAIEELREAGRRVQRAEESHTVRNTIFLLTGVALGVFFNPITGEKARSMVRDTVFGEEQPFQHQSSNEA